MNDLEEASEAVLVKPGGRGPSLLVRLLGLAADGRRRPLRDRSEVRVERVGGEELARTTVEHPVFAVEFFGLNQPGDIVAVKIYPELHRPCGQFIRLEASPAAGWNSAVFVCPVRPVSVVGLRLAPKIPTARMLEALGPSRGAFLKDGEAISYRASFFNVWAKLDQCGLLGHVGEVYEVELDRIWFSLAGEIEAFERALSRLAVRPVSAALHRKPPDGILFGSWKTMDLYGGLQVTVWARAGAGFHVDADIDEAAGLAHMFHVMRNALAPRKTHPIDIHQILAEQGINPGYEPLTRRDS